MKTTPIKPFLSETVVAEVMQAIQSKSARLAATYHDDLYRTLEQRRCSLGGMLELARALDAWRLVHAVEDHMNDLRRQMEAL
ncbi:MAG TPA: hypothetical protein VGC34_06925 [Steroidobacteraceae bacterium]